MREHNGEAGPSTNDPEIRMKTRRNDLHLIKEQRCQSLVACEPEKYRTPKLPTVQLCLQMSPVIVVCSGGGRHAY